MAASLPVRRTWLLLVIFLLTPITNTGAAQVFGSAVQRRPAAAAVAPPQAEAPKPQLLNADTNPTLRYPVAVKESSVSCGWLDVTRSSFSYSVVESAASSKPTGKMRFAPAGAQHLLPVSDPGTTEGFDLSLGQIQYLGLQKYVLLLITSHQKRTLIYLPQENCATLVEKRGAFDDFARVNIVGTMAVQRAIQNFAGVLADVKPLTPPALDVSLRADPASVEKGHSVALAWASNNATSLDLEPGVGRVAAAGGMSLQPQDSTNYILTATGPAGTKSASVHVTVTSPAVPTMILTEPSVGNGQTVEVTSTPLIVRGVAMDSSGIPVVTVNGRPVTLRPTSSQAAQFLSDPVNLQPGDNRVEVSATNNAHGQTQVNFVAHLTSTPSKAQPAPAANSKGLDKAEILSLLQGEVPSARVSALVRERGLKFSPTPDDLKEIRSAGGGDDLIDAVNQASASGK